MNPHRNRPRERARAILRALLEVGGLSQRAVGRAELLVALGLRERANASALSRFHDTTDTRREGRRYALELRAERASSHIERGGAA